MVNRVREGNFMNVTRMIVALRSERPRIEPDIRSLERPSRPILLQKKQRQAVTEIRRTRKPAVMIWLGDDPS